MAKLRRLHETLQLEIIAVIESLEQLKESAEYELCGIASPRGVFPGGTERRSCPTPQGEQKPGVLDELAAERVKLLERGGGWPDWVRNISAAPPNLCPSVSIRG